MTATSFVLTVFNKQWSLPKVLAAVAAERVDVGGEIILVDDGSTDESASLLAAFTAAEPRARLVSRRNGGVTVATNTGASLSVEAHVRLVDADDVLVAGSTRRLIGALRQAKAGLAFGAYAEAAWDALTVPLERPPAEDFALLEPALDEVATRVIVSPSTAVFDGALLRSVLPLDDRYRSSQDYSLALRIAERAALVRTPAVTAVGPLDSQPGGRLSTDKARMFRDTALITADRVAAWPWRTQRRTLARQATRARLYGRRHLAPDWHRDADLIWLRLAADLGLPLNVAAALRRVAAVYRAP